MERLKENESSSNWGYLLPISIIVFLVPLIVLLKVVELKPIEISYWTGVSENPDFFSYYKMVALNILTILGMIFTYFYLKRDDSKFRKTFIYIPMAIYTLFIGLSALLAEHNVVAFWGFVDRYEGMFSLLSYMVIMFISINLIKNKSSVKAVLYPLIVSGVILGLIGIFQYFGHDFFQSTIGKTAILTGEYKSMAENLKFNFGKNTIYSTLYNTNYVGSYMAMLFPMLLTGLILLKDKRKKLILAPIIVLMFLNLVGSNSRGGIIGTSLSLIILIVMIRKQILKNWKIVLISLALLLAGSVYVNKASEGRLIGQITRLKNDIVTLISKEEASRDPNEYKITEISSKDNNLKIVTTTETLIIGIENDNLTFFDGENNPLEIEFNNEEGTIKLLDEKYQHYDLKMISDGIVNFINLSMNGYIAKFTVEDNTFKYYQGNGLTKEIKKIKSSGFEGKEALGSYRGYIWSRSIPVLKENIILGKGPDTYAIYFPQEDFIGRFNTKSFPGGILVDKPHNLYLQIGINTGVISLLAFLSIMIMYLIQSIKTYFKRSLEDEMEIMGLGIFIAVCGYLIAGIFNDSVISVAPVFWVLLGTGVAINHILIYEKESV